VFSKGRYSSGGTVGRDRSTISRCSGKTTFSFTWPRISSSSTMTGVRYLSARLNARTVRSKVSRTV
jgi:hypothetical protein